MVAVASLGFAGMAAAAPAPRLDFTPDELALARSVAAQPGLASFYGQRALSPVFSGPDAAARRKALIDAIDTAPRHGLPVARYDVDMLRSLDASAPDPARTEVAFARSFARWVHDVGGGLLDPRKLDAGIHREVVRQPLDKVLVAFAAAPDPGAVLRSVEPGDPRYLALQAALAEQNRLVAPADAPLVPSGLWRPGASGPAITALRARLAAIGFAAGAGDIYDQPLTEAVAAYQTRAGLNVDGIAGPRTVAAINQGNGAGARALLIALERMRWMNGHDLRARHVWVNLPEYTARVMDGGHEVFQTRVVIGKADPQMRTPEFSDLMEYLVVNPRWNVPRSITVKEYLPRLQANRYAVSQLDVVDSRGRVVSRDSIDFASYTAASFPYRMRQKPSDDNALGQVKFIFPNRWNIYLHDTPTKHLFNQSRRAYSHGCIRVGRPVDLAHELLRGQVADPVATYARALNSGKESWLHLEPGIPVHLVYFTAFPDENGAIHRYPDIYGRDAAVWAALAKAGLENTRPGE